MIKTRTRTKVLFGSTILSGIGAIVTDNMEQKKALSEHLDDMVTLEEVTPEDIDVEEAVSNITKF